MRELAPCPHTRINGDSIHWPPCSQDLSPKPLDFLVFGQVRADGDHMPAEGFDFPRGMGEPLILCRYQNVKSILGKGAGKVISDAAGCPGNNSERTCRRICHR